MILHVWILHVWLHDDSAESDKVEVEGLQSSVGVVIYK